MSCAPPREPTRRRVTQSSSRLISTLSAAHHAHRTLAADDAHRANELAQLQQAAKLDQPHFAGIPAECSNPALR
eukprot:CAMPEP_0115881290 /NCGR_PEP_ID=MMETSP0287-20121206/28354_1 /TAXON_ID=412157 /ORGANISM="Chrysochromulina rotalis, Strain UIO044" /LENGTH=73 /DNA_ID=CAMNT_0003337215 /DNA_START=153 /DNA_END=374 /DNA_ORIENTATION=+